MSGIKNNDVLKTCLVENVSFNGFVLIDSRGLLHVTSYFTN